jgi:hypothetical protein
VLEIVVSFFGDKFGVFYLLETGLLVLEFFLGVFFSILVSLDGTF